MAKVWVATEGEYSEYHVLGVYSTREAAAARCRLAVGKWKEHANDPLEFELDEGNPAHWEAALPLVRRVTLRPMRDPEVSEPFHGLPEKTCLISPWGAAGSAAMGVVEARDAEHAVKIVSDAVAKLRARQEGV